MPARLTHIARLTALFCVVATAPPAAGQGAVTVPFTEETDGTSFPVRANPATYQAYYNQSNFDDVTQPVLITGVRYRLAAPLAGELPMGNFPTQTLTWADYTVQLSQPSAAVNSVGEFSLDLNTGTPNTTFAQNQGAGVTTVRSGPLTVAAGSFTQNNQVGVANPFGPLIVFTTPYLYTPDTALLFTVGHSGHGIAAEPEAFLAAAGFATNITDAVGLDGANSFTTTAGQLANPVIVEFTFAPVPEPAAVLAVAAAGLGAAGRVGRRFQA